MIGYLRKQNDNYFVYISPATYLFTGEQVQTVTTRGEK